MRTGNSEFRRYLPAMAVAAASVLAMMFFTAYSFSVSRYSEFPQVQQFSGSDILCLYRLDVQTMEHEAGWYLRVSRDYPLRRKLEMLAAQLSRLKFNGLPIQLLDVVRREARDIAVVNLRERELLPDGARSPEGWMGLYFQGSTGAQDTRAALLASFLQPLFPGPWIDAVTFLYEGDPLPPLDHIDLSGVFYRNEYSY